MLMEATTMMVMDLMTKVSFILHDLADAFCLVFSQMLK